MSARGVARLGAARPSLRFDDAFEAARVVLETFDVAAAVFVFDGTPVRVEQGDAASEVYEAWEASRGEQPQP